MTFEDFGNMAVLLVIFVSGSKLNKKLKLNL